MVNEITERLIECVRRYEYLYDLSHKDYKNVTLKNTTWESIGTELNISGDTAKNKWKTIRDGYTKYKKQVKSKNSFYTWASQLEFLEEFHTQRGPNVTVQVKESPPSSRNETPTFESESSQDSTTLSPRAPSPDLAHVDIFAASGSASKNVNRPGKRIDDVGRVLRLLSSKKRREHDIVDNLFLSYADTFKKFPLREQAVVKLELAKLFSSIELKLLDDNCKCTKKN